MTPEEFANKMAEYAALDPEGGHSFGDKLMCELLKRLGYEEGVKIFQGMDKWYA